MSCKSCKKDVELGKYNICLSCEETLTREHYDQINEHNKKVLHLNSLINYKYAILNALFNANDKDKEILKERLKEAYEALEDFESKYDGFFSLKILKPCV